MKKHLQIFRAANACLFLVSWMLPAARLSAVEIRTYSAERHDRFTGYPSAPEFNDSAYYGSRRFSGVAWIPGEGNSRQFALVSPQHVVFALHYVPGAGTPLRFLNADGTIVDRTISSVMTILNDSSQPTDLCLVRLSSPLLQSDRVAHFPYLNLSSESAYLNTTLTIFGWEMKAGRSSLSSILDLNYEGINTTRGMRFRYPKIMGNQDDARVVVGDSGSPSFGWAGTNPAIVGIHTAAGDSITHYEGYDSFIPHYVTKLDALMASDGYRMTPAYPPSVTLAASLVVPSTLKQSYAGSCRIDLSNTGANDAGNARIALHFQSGHEPTSVTATGWITESSGPQNWILRRANITAGATEQIEISWNEMPAAAWVPIELTRVADGSPSAVQNFQLTPLPTFKAWASELSDPTQSGDPDHDGVSNLLEYAFGGDPETPTMISESGAALLPVITHDGGNAEVTFPIRTDFVARALTYTPEFSEDLETWSAENIPVIADQTSAFDPASESFMKRTISWSTSDPRRFFRVRVTLAE